MAPQLKSDTKIPKHLAFIIDGNRRWAKKEGKKFPWEGHRAGAERLDKILKDCMELGVPQVSVYMLSTENLKRPKREIQELFDLYYEYLKKWEKQESKSLLDKYNVKVRAIGDLDKLPPKIKMLTGKIMQRTAKHQKHVLNLMIAYGAKYELTEVMKKVAQKALDTGRVEITQRDIEDNLMVPVPLDLVIRTGGGHRLSNFMLWQASYAEIFVTDTLWPDFSREELIRAFEWYSKTQRNFGK